MTNEELQTQLDETKEELRVAKRSLESITEGWFLLMSQVQPYKCKTCMLFHFPEPVKECQREN
jgi:hypothetical protein